MEVCHQARRPWTCAHRDVSYHRHRGNQMQISPLPSLGLRVLTCIMLPLQAVWECMHGRAAAKVPCQKAAQKRSVANFKCWRFTHQETLRKRVWGKRAGTCVSRTYGGLYLLSSCLAALTIQAGAACGTLCPLGSSGTGGVAEQQGCSQRAIQ